MQQVEILALAGLRLDGRKSDEIRRIQCRLGSIKSADGSAYFEQGLNKVLVTVHGPQEPSRRSDQINNQEGGFLSVRLLNASFSGNERKKKRPGDRKSNEIETIIKQTFDSLVLLDIYHRSEISICIQIFESDGSVISTILNATTMALMDAGISLKDMVISCSVSIQKKQIIYLDVTQTEQSSSNSIAFLPIAITSRNNEIVFMQLDSRIAIELVEEALKVAIQGCLKIRKIMEESVKDRMMESLRKIG